MATRTTTPTTRILHDPFRLAGAVLLVLAAVFVALGAALLLGAVDITVPVRTSAYLGVGTVFGLLLIAVVATVSRAAPGRSR